MIETVMLYSLMGIYVCGSLAMASFLVFEACIVIRMVF